MNALLRKEVRDAFRWLPLGILLQSLFLVYDWRDAYAPTLSSQLHMVTWFAALLYGSFLSLVTFLPDERESARAFLMHRAIAQNQIFRTRVLVGLLVYGLGMLIPLAALAVYLAAIGPHRAPVSPWQVVPACLATVSGSIFYFAGIVIACRPAHWFGTRLLPLAAAIGGSFLSLAVFSGAPLYVSLPILALSCLCVLWMAFAARHAFIRMPSQVSPTRVRSKSLALDSVLLASSVLFTGAIGLLPLNFIGQTTYRYPTIEFDKTGMPVYVVRGSAVSRDGVREVLEMLPMSDPSEPKPENIELSEPAAPFAFVPLVDSPNKFDPTFVHSVGDRQVFFDPAGYLLVYQRNIGFGSMLEYVIASDAVTLPNELRGRPFRKPPRFLVSQNSYPPSINNFGVPNSVTIPVQSLTQWTIATSDGFKQVDLEKRTIATLIKDPIDSITIPVAGNLDRVAIRSGDSLRVYKGVTSQPNAEANPLALESTLQISTNASTDANGILNYQDSENWTFLDGNVAQREFHVTRSSAGKTRAYTFMTPDETLQSLGRIQSEAFVVFGALPPLLTVGSLAISQTFTDSPAVDYWPLLFPCLVTIALTVFAARYRGLSSRQTALWGVLAGLIGFGVPLAVLAIYPVAIYETCNACQRRRRVENETCEPCGAHWDALPNEGIEILESGAMETMTAVGPT